MPDHGTVYDVIGDTTSLTIDEGLQMAVFEELLQLYRNERIRMVCTYLNQNVSAGDDYRDNEQNFGVHVFEGRTTKLKQGLARAGGAAIDGDLITAPEPILTPP